ncbi:MAG: hypothetical protein ABL889_15885 [Terricaulis sp.]
MSITISAHPDLALHRIDFFGSIKGAEIAALANTHSTHKDWAGADTIHVVDEAADLSEIDHAGLDKVRAHYQALHRTIDFFLLRRAGWVCVKPQALNLVEYWLKGRHSLDGQGTEVNLVQRWQDLTDVFTVEELAAAERGHGLAELWRVG